MAMGVATELSGMDTLVRLCAPDVEPPRPSAMLVLAHPDDEAVGMASLLPSLTLAAFVYLTDGAPMASADADAAGCGSRDASATVRRGELLSALESAGIAAARVEFVDCVDQEASLELVPLTLWLEILMREHAPAIVLTHSYEGGHPDHDSAAFAVHCARRRIEDGGDPAPIVGEFTSYHVHQGHWEFGTFLGTQDPRHVLTRTLSPDEIALKRRVIGCYASQRAVLRQVPLVVERFRVAPDYDFTRPPHDGVLLYEQFSWGINGEQWRERARVALEALELPTRRRGSMMEERAVAMPR